jgi:hypothetical protein
MSIVEAKRAALRREAEELADHIVKAAQQKSWPDWLSKRVSDHNVALKDFERQQAAEKATPAWATAAGDAGHAPTVTAKNVSRVASPLNIPVSEYKGMYHAAVKRLPSYRVDIDHADVTVKSPFAESGFTSGTLPPTLLPKLTLDLPYQPDRAFAHFKQMPAPESIGVEYIQHTGNTNPAAAVAELGTKPDLGGEPRDPGPSTHPREVECLGTVGFSILANIQARCTHAAVKWTLVTGGAVCGMLEICDPRRTLPVAKSV